MEMIILVGLVAATFTTISLFPQLLKSWKTRFKPTSDSTLVAYSMLFCVGIFLWLIYGMYLQDTPMIVANTLSYLQGIIILFIQFRRLKHN